MWTAHSLIALVLPLIAQSQDHQPCDVDHYQQQPQQQSPITREHMYGGESCGEKICASDGYRYVNFQNRCQLNEYNLKLLLAGHAEFIVTDPLHCEQAHRALSYPRLPYRNHVLAMPYSPYAPSLFRESAVMQNFRYRSRNYYERPVSSSYEHAAEQSSSVVTTNLGQMGESRTSYWRQPDHSRYHRYYDRPVGHTPFDAYMSPTTLGARPYAHPSSHYDPTNLVNATTQITPSTTNEPPSSTISTTIVPNTISTSEGNIPASPPTATPIITFSPPITSESTSTESTSTTNATSTITTPTTLPTDDPATIETSTPSTTTTIDPNAPTVVTTIAPTTTTPLTGINPVSPPTTVATTNAPKTSTPSTTDSLTTTTEATTNSSATTTTTSTTPTSTSITSNITTTTTTIPPNKTTPATSPELPSYATTTTSGSLHSGTTMNSNNNTEPIAITIRHPRGSVLTFVLAPLESDELGYPTCTQISTAQITRGAQVLFKFTGCSETNSTSISKSPGSPIRYSPNISIYRSPSAPSTKRPSHYYKANSSGATCAHSYASHIIYNY